MQGHSLSRLSVSKNGVSSIFQTPRFSHIHTFQSLQVHHGQDWISVSVLTAPPDPFPRRPLPEALAELQRRSSHLRGRVVGTNGREAGAGWSESGGSQDEADPVDRWEDREVGPRLHGTAIGLPRNGQGWVQWSM